MRQKIKSDDGDRLLEVLGNQITIHRDMIGVTQTELARRVHVSRFQMCKHESGSAEMPVTRLFAICQELRVPPNDFMRSVTKALRNGA